jgi:hypothetical protein
MYDLAMGLGKQAGYNDLSKTAGANGGNIDSFAAAQNAMQLKSFQNQGVANALAARNMTLDKMLEAITGKTNYQQGMYDSMGRLIGYTYDGAQQTYDNYQDGLNQQTNRLVSQSEVTGQVPFEWSDKNNPYLNPDGTVKAQYLTEEFDNTGGFTALYNNPNISDQDKYYISRAFGLKTDLPQYRQYAGAIPVAGTQQTAAVIKDDKDRDYLYHNTDTQADVDKFLGQEATKVGLAASAATTNAANTAANASMFGSTMDYQKALGVAGIQSADNRFIAEKSDPVQQIQAINNSSLPQEQKNALITSLLGANAMNSGNARPVVDFSDVNDESAKAYGVDIYGLNLLHKLKDAAKLKGGVLTDREIYEIAVNESDDNNTNKNQIGKVFKYLELGTEALSGVKDAGWWGDWTAGVKPN